MKFPSLRAYVGAIKNRDNINIPFFKSDSVQIFLNRRGQPYMSVGGFGAVFRFKDKNNNQYAFKVFTRDVPDRDKRYQTLHDTFEITRFPFMVDFQYVADGLKVGDKYFPVVVMEWGHAIPLDSAISQDLEDDGILQNAPVFAGRLFEMVKTLQEWNMGHGDLQEGNILVKDDNRLILIDYDGMFVPSLEGESAGEIGLADYQHPGRDNSHFSRKIDDFSLLSILYQLAIISPELWNRYHDDKRLIIRQADYQDFDKSLLIQRGLKSDKKHVRALASLLIEACSVQPLEINAVTKITAVPEIRNWLVVPEEVKPETGYLSIIEQVISLTGEQVYQSEFEGTEIVLPVHEDTGPQMPEVKERRKEAGRWDTEKLVFKPSIIRILSYFFIFYIPVISLCSMFIIFWEKFSDKSGFYSDTVSIYAIIIIAFLLLVISVPAICFSSWKSQKIITDKSGLHAIHGRKTVSVSWNSISQLEQQCIPLQFAGMVNACVINGGDLEIAFSGANVLFEEQLPPEYQNTDSVPPKHRESFSGNLEPKGIFITVEQINELRDRIILNAGLAEIREGLWQKRETI